MMTQKKEEKEKLFTKIRVIWFFLRPFKGLLSFFILISLFIGIFEAANIAILYLILSFGLEAGTSQHYYITDIFNKIVSILPIDDQFIGACVLFILVTAGIVILKYISVILRVHLANNIQKLTKEKMFVKYMKSDYQYFIENKQGELIYNIRNAPGYINTVFHSLSFLIADVLMAVSILFLLFTLSWQGTILMGIIGIVYYFFTRSVGARISYTTGKGLLDASQRETVTVNEAINGIKTVKVYKAEESWKGKYNTTVADFIRNYKKQETWNQIPALLLEIVMFTVVGLMAIILRLAYPYDFSALLPIFGAFGFAVFRLLPRFTSFGNIRMKIMASLPNLELIKSIMEKKTIYIEDGKKELNEFKKGIYFKDVHFTYKTKTQILKGINLFFEKGKTTAIVGSSGSGKTTIINLILRLFDPDKGEIKVDSENVKNIKQSSWLSRIGFVSQETFIYNASIKDNITFGEDYSEKDILKAVKIANAKKFIEQMPMKYDTLVGDRGMTLSGGQMQRIAIARAVIRNPEIIILDEATSALDNVSEKTVQKAINKISKDRTVIVIAHRLSTIINADKIIVLDKGVVAEEGTHNKLLKNKGVYWELNRTQEIEMK